LEGRSLWNSFM